MYPSPFLSGSVRRAAGNGGPYRDPQGRGPARDTIQAALKMVKTKDLRTWALENLGVTLQAKRRAAFPPSANGTKTG